MEQYVLNPNTKRFIVFESKGYYKLLNKGIIFDKIYNLPPVDKNKCVLHPNTNKFIIMGGAAYYNLIREGIVFDKIYDLRGGKNKKYALNPNTNKMVRISTKLYRKLLREGVVFEKFYDTNRSKFVCVAKGCKGNARFAKNAGDRDRYCTDHKTEEMIDVNRKVCNYPGCTINPCYGLIDEQVTRCFSHQLPNMISIRMCQHDDCQIAASYGYKTRDYCIAHKLDDMKQINKLTKICIFKNCPKRAYYGLPDGKIEWCKDHSDENMVCSLKYKFQCVTDGCDKNAHYGYVGEKPKHCSKHSNEKMVNLNHSECQFLGCKVLSSYGLPETGHTHCTIHKSDDMVIKQTILICTFKDCTKNATCGIKGSRPTHCRNHKLSTMVVIWGKTCIHKNCEKEPSFGLENGPILYCGVHQLPNMRNLKYRICNVENCNNYGYYGIPGKIVTKCLLHKDKGMITNPKRKCRVCKTGIALYGSVDDKSQQRCEEHKLKDDINYLEKKCISCGLDNILNDDEKCCYCSVDKTVRLIKQKEVVEYLIRQDLSPDTVDKQVEDGTICGLRSRPDLVYNCGTHFIVLEVDEHQHQSYPCECEIIRMINLTQVIGLKTMFLRYNPDKFKSDLKEPNKTFKLKSLKEELQHYMKNPQDDLLTVKYLFYDDYKYVEEPIHTIM